MAGVTFLGTFLWDVDWIGKAWKNRKRFGVYAFIGALAPFTVFIFAGAYLDSKAGGPERRAAELKALKEKADAARHERMLKSFGEKKAPKEEPRRNQEGILGRCLEEDWIGPGFRAVRESDSVPLPAP